MDCQNHEKDTEKSLTDKLTLWLWSTGVRLSASLPWRVQCFLGRLTGRVMFVLLRYRREIAAINISRCLPHLSKDKQKILLQQNFEACGIGLFECANAWCGKDAPSVINGLDELYQCQKNGHGVLVLCGHFSPLELIASLLAKKTNITMIYRKFSNHLVNQLITEHRERSSIRQINRHEPIKIIKALKRGEIVILAWDQYSGALRSVFSEFFGHPVCTPIFPMWLAKFIPSSNVFFASYYREKKTSHYLMEATPISCLFSASMKEEDVKQSARELNQCLEEAILRAPEQYLWMHSRFKRQPPESPSVYPSKK